MRAQRKISEEEEAVPAEAEALRHAPSRPSWTCEVGCGDWPCAKFREHMRVSMPAVEASMVMANFYVAAVRELDLPPAEVHRRLFGWIDGPKPPEPLRWHLPGGSI